MKVTLDLDELRQAGEIDEAEYEKFTRLAKRSTGSLAFNILIGFGVIAVSASVLVMVPNAGAALVLGAILASLGLYFQQRGSEQWALFAQICIVVGALMAGGAIVALGEGSVASFLLVAIAFAAGGVMAGNGLLIALAVLALASCLGVRTAYFHASYFLGVQEPLLTIAAFSVLALVTYQASLRLKAPYERLAIMAARVSVLLVNLGFWVGSLWGDSLDQLRQMGVLGNVMIPRPAFAVLWAIALMGVAMWGVRENRRWVVNIAAIFGAVHFYTQWFAHLGANPFTVFLAGLIALGLALAFWHFNKQAFGGKA